MTTLAFEDDAGGIAHGLGVVAFPFLEGGFVVEVEARAICTGEGQQALCIARTVPLWWSCGEGGSTDRQNVVLD